MAESDGLEAEESEGAGVALLVESEDKEDSGGDDVGFELLVVK